ncbi:hypothetical protein ACFW9D_15880 [Streptomyces sp. NPDC059524]
MTLRSRLPAWAAAVPALSAALFGLFVHVQHDDSVAGTLDRR